MVVQLVVYFMFSLLLYHSFWTFKFINTFFFEKNAFVLKPQVALNELELVSIDITCPSIINKYLNYPNPLWIIIKKIITLKKKIQNVTNPKLLGL